MSQVLGFVCSRCGEYHEDVPFGYSTIAPVYWREEFATDSANLLTSEQCVIDRRYFFLRGRIVLPVLDAEPDFEWGVWISLSAAHYQRANQVWDDPQRVREPPYFGWLSTEVPIYQPTTVNLKTRVHTQAVGVRPVVELEPNGHPLAVEQRTGITVARVQTITELVLHAGQSPTA